MVERFSSQSERSVAPLVVQRLRASEQGLKKQRGLPGVYLCSRHRPKGVPPLCPEAWGCGHQGASVHSLHVPVVAGRWDGRAAGRGSANKGTSQSSGRCSDGWGVPHQLESSGLCSCSCQLKLGDDWHLGLLGPMELFSVGSHSAVQGGALLSLYPLPLLPSVPPPVTPLGHRAQLSGWPTLSCPSLGLSSCEPLRCC